MLLLALRTGGAADVGQPIAVKRADLVLSVDVEGELAAVRSTEIGVPPIAEVDFKIAFLAPEGQAVKKGESVLRLDAEMLERQLAEKRAEYQEAEKKCEQKEIDLGMKLLDLEQQAAQAKAELGRAQLKVDVPPEVQQRLELEKAVLDKRGRERDLQNLDAEGRVTKAVTGAELVVAAPAARPRGRPRDGAPGRHREDERQGAAGRDRRLQAELARREEEGRRLGLVRRDGAGPARTSPR